jgi:hypothetical protein
MTVAGREGTVRVVTFEDLEAAAYHVKSFENEGQSATEQRGFRIGKYATADRFLDRARLKAKRVRLEDIIDG